MEAKKKHCESGGHSDRTATHKRDGLFEKEKKVYMCCECANTAGGLKLERLNVQELKEPGHDD